MTSEERPGGARVTRRHFGKSAGSLLATVALSDGCLVSPPDARAREAQTPNERLTARPSATAARAIETGPLGLGGDRDGAVHLPSTVGAGPVPLLVLLHGATQSGTGILRRLSAAADEAGIAVVAPDSRGRTWDAIRDTFGEDVAFLNRALEHVFARLPVDARRMAIGGFSDGASYALSLGLANGELFRSIVAFSPGFVVSTTPQGRPRCFVSHGTADQILPIDRCSRVIVPRLRSIGYDVTFREFEGRHEVPPAIASEGLHWMLAD